MSAASWTFGSIFAQAILQIAVTSILAHFIPPEEFGLFAIATMVIGIIGTFAQIGVGPTVVQRKELTDHFISAALIISLGLGLLGFILTWIAAPVIANFFNQAEVTDLLRAASYILIISGYTTVASALLQREILFRKLAIINVTSYIIGYGII
jgi:O-antigen/teichoic acid export membrane protein